MNKINFQIEDHRVQVKPFKQFLVIVRPESRKSSSKMKFGVLEIKNRKITNLQV